MNGVSGRRLGIILLAVVLVPAFSPAGDKAGGAFKELGRDMKEFGKKVGKAGKEAGLQIADAARKVWYKSWKVSAPKLVQVQNATRDHWRQVLQARDRTLADLRRESAELKRRLAEKSSGG